MRPERRVSPGRRRAVRGATVGEFASMPGFCFFHFVRRFCHVAARVRNHEAGKHALTWNHILTCVSVSLRERARFRRSQTER